MSTDYVRIEGITRTFGAGENAVHALRGIDLAIRQGEYVAIKGRSGSGKTTLLNLIGGLDRATSGRIEVGGADVTAMTDAELLTLRRERVSYVFQSFGLIPILTARENVSVPLRLNKIPPRDREERVTEVLTSVGLAGHQNQVPGQLSGGQQQRVGLARALAAKPGLLLADEPTGQLDSHTARDIMTLIGTLVRTESMTAIVTTHDPLLLSLADRVIEIADGHLVA
ncbi:ABC transporter ATP-binding protein [Nostocoides jenkinsii]|jgi:putative ABC transport system ATP-binding protein|uniref:Putative ABC transporter (ATP-binding protein) n=1 Tax=Nostocoides jenkinsii Ben 74 TaxID=1193518 RepID=A0A077MFX8_9MICO|nr:ABC transporter ATP-binding protein [Tetrasphaera jenkinsii]CCI54228.1 putative ABC transporter (ATP-binding protein) [Tetrasphaera jenkinsii Ben 74]